MPRLAATPARTPTALVENNTEGASNYNSLQASLTKQVSHGVQFLASYTFSKNMDSDAVSLIEAANSAIGDGANPHAR